MDINKILLIYLFLLINCVSGFNLKVIEANDKKIDGTFDYFFNHHKSKISNTSNKNDTILFESNDISDFRTLEESARTRYTKHFRIIWGEGIYILEPPWNDENDNDYPDFIDGVYEVIDFIWEQFIENFHLRPPYNSDHYFLDIYIANTYLQDPHNTSQTLILNNLYYGYATSYDDGTPFFVINDDIDLNTLKSILAHEFFHTIQFNYKTFEEAESSEHWWYEASAVWAENALYEKLSGYHQHIQAWVHNSHLSLFNSDFGHSYGSVIWAKYLSEKYHDSDDPSGGKVIGRIWEHFANNSLISAWDKFFSSQKVFPEITTLSHAYADFIESLLDLKYGSFIWNKILFPDEILIVENAPQPWGIYPISFSRPENCESLINLYFDGTDKFNGITTDWVIAFQLLSEDDEILEQYSFFADDFGYGNIQIKNSLPWEKGRLLITPLSNDNNLIYQLTPVPFRLSFVEIYDEKPEYQDWQDEQEIITDMRAHGGVQLHFENGWNLLGFPSNSTKKNIKDRLSPIYPSIESIWAWKNNSWQVFSPDKKFKLYYNSLGFKPLENIEHWQGFWVNMKNNATLNEKLSRDNSQITK